jgi:DNA-binding transcriptional MerR regulator
VIREPEIALDLDTDVKVHTPDYDIDMRIGELSTLTNTSTRAIRHYERQGLLRARRAANGYRDFERSSVALIRHLRTLLDAGFTLADARVLLRCVGSKPGELRPCASALRLYERKLAALDARLSELQTVRSRVARGLGRLRGAK